MTYVNQSSFASGEIMPEIFSRVDIAKNQVGLKTALNYFIKAQGGAHNRPGSMYVLPCLYQDKDSRLIKFQFSNTQTYVLEFGDQYMRVHKDGGTVLETAKNVTAATKANPCVITSVAHGFNNGDWVYIAAVGGMTQINGKFFKVANKAADTFELQTVYGVNVNSSAYTTYTSGGTASRVYTLATTYLEADLPMLKFSQRKDDITIVCAGYAPKVLTRTGHAAWTLTANTFAPGIADPANETVTAHIEASPYYSISGATKANPCVVTTSSAHGLSNNEYVYIYDVAGMTQINGLFFKVAVPSSTTFSLMVWDTGAAVDSSAYGVWSSGGKVIRTAKPRTNRYKITAVAEETLEESLPTGIASCVNDVTTTGNYDTVSWDAVSGAAEYRVYHARNGLYGYIGKTPSLTFDNNNIEPDFSLSPPGDRNPFNGADAYPSVVVHHQQRRVFGGSNDFPSTVYGSQITNYNNFNVASPAVASDAWTFTCDSNEVNIVKHLLSIGQLLVMTSANIFLFKPGSATDTITPNSINVTVQSSIGSSDVPPITVGDVVLFVESGNPTTVPDLGTNVYDLGYRFDTDKYAGDELTILSKHLFRKDKTIKEWCYARNPYGLVWIVRSDGSLITFTYLKAHDVKAWSRNETFGSYKSITSVPENGEDVVYVIVEREINGTTRKYIERFASREFINVEDGFFVDSGLTYDAWNTTAVTITASGGTTWEVEETITLTASSATFSAGDVGKILWLRTFDDDGVINNMMSFEIIGYTSTTVVTANPRILVPTGLRSVATSYWGWGTDTISGLDHLEGETVSVFAHGTVHEQQVVTGGEISLDDSYVKAHVGLPYNCDLETLDIAGRIESGNFVPRKFNMTQCAIHLMKSQGLYVGSDADNLYQLIDQPGLTATGCLELMEGIEIFNVTPDWATAGRIFTRVSDPVPCSILGVIPDVEMGD